MRRKVARVLGRAAHRELVAIGDAEHHRARVEKALHRGAGVGRHEALQDLRARRGLDSLHAQHVLHRHRNAGKRPGRAGAKGAIGRLRLLRRLGRGQAKEGFDVGVGRLDPFEVQAEELLRRNLALVEQVPQLADRQVRRVQGH